MRVVITGATGNVGTSLIDRLSGEDVVESIVGIARREPTWTPPKTTWLVRDVGRESIEDALAAADAVVHLAWLIQPSRKPQELLRVNIEGSEKVFRAAVNANVRTIVYASSVGAYSPGSQEQPVDESWPTHGVETSMYSRHKAYVERLLDTIEAEQPDMRIVRMRPALIFKRESATSQRRYFMGPFLPTSLLRPGALPRFPSLSGVRFQALHSEDAADAYALALLSDARGAFNIAAEPILGFADVAKLLDARPVTVPKFLARAAVSASFHLRLQPTDSGWLDLARQAPLLDSTRARRELGWTPKRSSIETMSEFLAGISDKAGAPTPVLQPEPGGSIRPRESARK